MPLKSRSLQSSPLSSFLHTTPPSHSCCQFVYTPLFILVSKHCCSNCHDYFSVRPPTTPRHSDRVANLLPDGLSTCKLARITGVSKSLTAKMAREIELSPLRKGGRLHLVDSPTCCCLCYSIKDTETWTTPQVRAKLSNMLGVQPLLGTTCWDITWAGFCLGKLIKKPLNNKSNCGKHLA